MDITTSNGFTMNLNRIDRHILRVLQQDGRITYSELASRVGLTTTPCIERVRKLEREGVLQGFTALVDPTALGAGLVVFVQISLAHIQRSLRRIQRGGAKTA